MNVLVLGGSKFVGQDLVRGLVEHGYKVWVLNRGVTPTEFPPGVERLRTDRFDPAAMQAVLKDRTFDAVFDISGFTTKEVGIAVDALKGKVKQYIFCSSTAVCARSDVLPITEASPLLRDPKGRKYGLDKVACEELVARAAKEHGFQFSIVRPTNVYGPNNNNIHREFAHSARLEMGRPILLPAHGLPLVPLAYIGDVTQLFLKCLGNPSAYGEAFTATSGQVISLRGWVHLLAELVGVEPRIVSPPPELEEYVEWSPLVPAPAASWPFEWRWAMIFSVEKAQRVLGYIPTPFRQGLASAYQWYKKQTKERWKWDFSRDDECLRKMGVR